MPDNLRRCPFCGSEDVSMLCGSTYSGHCFACKATGPACVTETDAIAAWNRRAQPAPDGLREALKDAWLSWLHSRAVPATRSDLVDTVIGGFDGDYPSTATLLRTIRALASSPPAEGNGGDIKDELRATKSALEIARYALAARDKRIAELERENNELSNEATHTSTEASFQRDRAKRAESDLATTRAAWDTEVRELTERIEKTTAIADQAVDERKALESRLAAMQAVVDALPKCDWWNGADPDWKPPVISCKRTATTRSSNHSVWCDEHRWGGSADLPYASEIRSLAALPAADAEATDPKRIAELESDLRHEVEMVRAERAARASVHERLVTVSDEMDGPHPVTKDTDEVITRIEQGYHKLFRESESHIAAVTRDLADAKAAKSRWAERYTKTREKAAGLESDLADARAQVDKLAQFISAEIPGEPSQSLGVVDTAIYWMTGALAIMRTKQEKLATLESRLAAMQAAGAALATAAASVGNDHWHAVGALHDEGYAEEAEESNELQEDLNAALQAWSAALPASDAPATDSGSDIYHPRGTVRFTLSLADAAKLGLFSLLKDAGYEVEDGSTISGGPSGAAAQKGGDAAADSTSAEAAERCADCGRHVGEVFDNWDGVMRCTECRHVTGRDLKELAADARRLVAEAEGRAVERAMLRIADALYGFQIEQPGQENRDPLLPKWMSHPYAPLAEVLRAAATNGGK